MSLNEKKKKNVLTNAELSYNSTIRPTMKSIIHHAKHNAYIASYHVQFQHFERTGIISYRLIATITKALGHRNLEKSVLSIVGLRLNFECR